MANVSAYKSVAQALTFWAFVFLDFPKGILEKLNVRANCAVTPPVNIPTLADVAKAAGVSTATVSRCLNTADKVSEKARAKVMKAVEDLGYTPNFGARAMAAKRTFTIGAIVPTMENAIFARGLQVFQEQLHARGYTLLVSSNAYQPEIEAEQIKNLIARGADGLLLIGFARDQSVYDFLDRRGVPTLIAWASRLDHAVPSIGFDNRAAMHALATQVLALGHDAIGVISAKIDGNDRAAGRVKGISDAMHDKGMDAARLSIVETSYTVEAGAAAFAELMKRMPQPTVVMCGNDVLAAGALRQARDMGMRVPEDVSITGFDDLELAQIVSPALTTVHVPHRQMGTMAANALIEMIEGKSREGQPKESQAKVTSVALPVEVMTRASLGPPPR